jgi:hypothetical protein
MIFSVDYNKKGGKTKADFEICAFQKKVLW